MSTDAYDEPHPLPIPELLLLFDGEPCVVQAWARPAGLRDGVDPMSELAVLAAASDLDHVEMIVPARLRDLELDAIVGRPGLLTVIERAPDGAIDLSARAIWVGDETPVAGAWAAMEPDGSPVASLLHDAVTMDVPLSLERVAGVLGSWGHVIATEPPLGPPDHAQVARDRYRVHRLAEELAQRHRPTVGPVEAKRPGIPYHLPDGFVAACPI